MLSRVSGGTGKQPGSAPKAAQHISCDVSHNDSLGTAALLAYIRETYTLTAAASATGSHAVATAAVHDPRV